MIALQRPHFEESDRALIRRFARERDGQAFSILMGRYADMVWTTCQRVLRDETQAADAVQETFFQLAKDAERITGSVGSWLHKVATCRAVDVIRQNASRRRREQSYASDAASPSNTWSEVEPAVDEALEELPESLREVLLQHFLQGRTTAQIAVTQGVSQPTISRRMNEALESLRQILRGRGIQAGLTPLQTVLLHTNRVAPAALRCGLGKIALAKATLSSTAWVASASAPAGAGAVKAALAGAAMVLAAGTTWVAHQEFSPRPAPVAVQTTVPPVAPESAGPGAPQFSRQGVPAESFFVPERRRLRLQPDTAKPFTRRAARGPAFPNQRPFAQRAPEVVLPLAGHTNIQSAHPLRPGLTNAEESPWWPPATNAVPARADARAPWWLYEAKGAAEASARPGAPGSPAAVEGARPDARAFHGRAAALPSAARGAPPVFLPNRTPAADKKK